MTKHKIRFYKESSTTWVAMNLETKQCATVVSFIDYGVFMQNPKTRYRVDVDGRTVSGIIDHYKTAEKVARVEVTKPLPQRNDIVLEKEVLEPKQSKDKPFHERLYEAFKKSNITERRGFAIKFKPYFILFTVELKEGLTIIEVRYSILSEHQRDSLQYTFEETTSSKEFNIYSVDYGNPNKLRELLNKIDTHTLLKMFDSKNPVIIKEAHAQ